jgi:hypothetical protein
VICVASLIRNVSSVLGKISRVGVGCSLARDGMAFDCSHGKDDFL